MIEDEQDPERLSKTRTEQVALRLAVWSYDQADEMLGRALSAIDLSNEERAKMVDRMHQIRAAMMVTGLHEPRMYVGPPLCPLDNQMDDAST